MTITAKIIQDTINHSDRVEADRLTTFELKYPRIIHAEFMTHRVFSRNASSSRAIPVSKVIQNILDDTAMPVSWGKNQSGMQAGEEHKEFIYIDGKKHSPTEAWYHARDKAIEVARAFNEAGYHKQVVNRLLEPFSHISVIVTATEWENFFTLRHHKDADPTFQVLAKVMRECMLNNTPVEQSHHLPYITDSERELYRRVPLLKMSSSRCARVSYLTHEGKEPSIESDLALYDRLVGSEPRHASPVEHQGRSDYIGSSELWGNFKGFIQNRKVLEKEWYK